MKRLSFPADLTSTFHLVLGPGGLRAAAGIYAVLLCLPLLVTAAPTLQTITITNPAPAGGDAFGWSVSWVGFNHFVIGAPYDDASASIRDSGSVYLYETDPFGTNILLIADITNPAPGASNLFGYAVA